MQETKAKTYIDVAQLIQTLRRFNDRSGIEIPDAAPGTGLLDAAAKLRPYLYPDASTDSRYRILQSIPALPTLAAAFDKLVTDLENKLDSLEEGPRPIKLGRPLYNELRDFVGKLDAEFEQLVNGQHIFIGPSRASQYEFLSLEPITGNSYDYKVFGCLPRLTQSYLKDAGRCLTYEMPGASVGLSLRAVETTLRYYFRRCLPNDKSRPAWGSMLNALDGAGKLPSKHCYNFLERLRTYYRNSIAHGRALLETGKQDVQLAAEEIFDDCWKAIRMLGEEAFQREELTVRISIHPDFDFDTALAAYLFRWNPEYPDVFQLQDNMLSNVDFDPAVPQDELHDKTLGFNGVIRAELSKEFDSDKKKALCQNAMTHLHVQDSFSATLDPLTDYVCRRKTKQLSSNFDLSNPRTTDVDLFDLFEGLCYTEIPPQQGSNSTSGSIIEEYSPIRLKDKPHHLLAATWDMLDLFVAKGVRIKNINLVTELKQGAAYQAFYRYQAEK